jgi:hypothetical protein
MIPCEVSVALIAIPSFVLDHLAVTKKGNEKTMSAVSRKSDTMTSMKVIPENRILLSLFAPLQLSDNNVTPSVNSITGRRILVMSLSSPASECLPVKM